MSAGHRHDRVRAEIPIADGPRRVVTVVAAALAVVTVVALVVIRLGVGAVEADTDLLARDIHAATVVGVEVGQCPSLEGVAEAECRVVTYRLDQGPHSGETRTQEFSVDSDTVTLQVGDSVVLNFFEGAEPPSDYQWADFQRRASLWWLAGLFALAVVALGRLRGVAALAGLVVSVVVVLEFVLPVLLDGGNPIVAAVVGASAIAYLALYLAHGFNPITTVALLGTLGALALTIALSWVFTALANFTGFASEEALELQIFAGSVNIEGLVLAGIVLGALGALDDVTITQASAVAELRAANPRLSRARVLGAGLRIGRDHVASAVNTLALAYIGAALPTFLLLVLSNQSLGTVANSEPVAVEIVRTLVGSIGLVAAVPITTWLASTVVGGPTDEEDVGGPTDEEDVGGPTDEEDVGGPPAEGESDPGTEPAPRDGEREPRRRGGRRDRRRTARRPPTDDEDPDVSFWTR